MCTLSMFLLLLGCGASRLSRECASRLSREYRKNYLPLQTGRFVCYIVGIDPEADNSHLLLDAGEIRSHPALKTFDRQGIPWFAPSGAWDRFALYTVDRDWERATAIAKKYADISTAYGTITFPKSGVELPPTDGKYGSDQWRYLAGLHWNPHVDQPFDEMWNHPALWDLDADGIVWISPQGGLGANSILVRAEQLEEAMEILRPYANLHGPNGVIRLKNESRILQDIVVGNRWRCFNR